MHGTSIRPAPTRPSGAPTVEITVVRAPACHFCTDAEETLAKLAVTYPLVLRFVELESPEGLRLTGQHRPAMNPLILLDGRFFSAGRLPRKKLAALLERAAAVDSTRVERAASGDVHPAVS